MTLVKDRQISVQTPQHTSFVIYSVAGVWFGVPTVMVREVYAPVPSITPVPHAPPGVIGLANLRSQLFLVISARQMHRDKNNSSHGEDSLAAGPMSRLILFKSNVAENCGLLVDAVGDIVNLAAVDVRPLAEDVNHSHAFVVGVGKLKDIVITLVDPRRLIESLGASK